MPELWVWCVATIGKTTSEQCLICRPLAYTFRTVCYKLQIAWNFNRSFYNISVQILHISLCKMITSFLLYVCYLLQPGPQIKTWCHNPTTSRDLTYIGPLPTETCHQNLTLTFKKFTLIKIHMGTPSVFTPKCSSLTQSPVLNTRVILLHWFSVNNVSDTSLWYCFSVNTVYGMLCMYCFSVSTVYDIVCMYRFSVSTVYDIISVLH